MLCSRCRSKLQDVKKHSKKKIEKREAVFDWNKLVYQWTAYDNDLKKKGGRNDGKVWSLDYVEEFGWK